MYTAQGTLDKSKQVDQYIPLVRRLAHHLIAKLPASVQIDDLIQAGLIGLMNTDDTVTGPINLGNPQEFTIGELARLVIELTGAKSALVHKPLPSDDPKQRCPDIGLARTTLGWTPSVQLREGLTRTIEYFDRQLKLGAWAPIGNGGA